MADPLNSDEDFYAEGVGFEPTNAFTSPVFKTGSIGRSDSPPKSNQELSVSDARVSTMTSGILGATGAREQA
jgi:hypothetical protein